MFSKQWKIDYQGNKILVTHTWGFLSFDMNNLIGKAKLYINGQKIDDYASLIAFGDIPVMSGKLDLGNGVLKPVEIYMKSGLFSIQAKICIDEIRIGGDNF